MAHNSRLFPGLHTNKDDDWTPVVMDEARFFLSFARNNPHFMSVFDVCFNSLFTGDLVISVGEDVDKQQKSKSPDDENRLEVPTAAEDEEMRWRSRVVTDWSREKELVRLAIGFVPTTGIAVANPTSDIDRYMPTVLNLDRIVIETRVDVYNQREWRIARADAIGPHKFIPNILVFGHEMPDNKGGIQSCVKRLYLNSYLPYAAKMTMTLDADAQRLYPMVITQQRDKVEPKTLLSVPSEQAANDALDELRPDRAAVHALVIEKNRCSSLDVGKAVGKINRRRDEYPIAPGREYAHLKVPDAPSDPLPFAQSWLEACCLTMGMPMSQISAGDSTGKQRLNARTASPETARMFMAAQAERARRIVRDVSQLWYFMYSEVDLLRFVKKRKDSRPTEAELRTRMRIHVSLPSNPPLEQLLLLYQMGFLTYDATCKMVGNKLSMPLSVWRSECAVDLHELNGTATAASDAPDSSQERVKHKSSPKSVKETGRKRLRAEKN